MKKKTLIMLLASILCIALLPAVAHAATSDVWDGSTASSLTGGGKSEDDPYLISTGAELKLLADNSRAAGLGSCYVKLTNDIVLNDGTFDKSGAFTKRGGVTIASPPNEWLPMGEASWHIDGDGHSISGMYIKCNEEKVGLVSKISSGGYIRDLTIKGSYVNSSHQSQSYTSYIGVFAGETSGTSLNDCAGENNIVVSSGYNATGGIVGFAWPGSITGVHASGSIQGSGALGGIVGRSSGVTFKNCWNEMDIDNASSYQSITQSGGIVALAEGSEFYNCANLGYLHGGSRVGGIAGEAPVKIKNCYTTRDISGIKEYGSRNYVATLVGKNKDVVVRGCYAEDGSDLYDIGAEGEGSYVPHFTGKGNLCGGSDGELLDALNENLYSMDAEPNLNKWVLNSDGYPIPTGETFVDDTVYYDIWLDGVRVSERNEADILGDGLASYDKATNTLFLHDSLVVTAAYNQKLLYSEGDINLCVNGDVKFQSAQNVGTGPCIIDLGSAGGSGNLKIYAPEGTSATVTVTGKYGEYGIDVSSLTLEGDVSLKVSADSAFAFCYTMTFTSPQAMLDAVSWGDNSAMRNPVQTINLPSSNAQKLYEDQGSGLVQVDDFTKQRKVDGNPYVSWMYPHIRIAPVVSELVDSLPASFTVSMADANDESSLAAWVLGEIREIEGITEDNSSVVVSDVQAATAGTFASQDGEAGSFTATVTLQMGGASMTKVIPGTIEPAAYAPPVITTEIKAGTVDAETGFFAEATDATFTCGDGVVFAVSYKADGVPVKDLQGSVSCYADKGLTWSEANGCYLTPTDPADCFTFTKAVRYKVIFKFLATGEYAAQVGSIDIDVVRRTLAPSDFTFAAPSDLAYDGSAKVASFEFAGKLSCDGAQTVSYLSDGATVSEAVEPGTYAVQLDVQECDSYNAATLTDSSWTFTIGPKQLSDLDFSDITVV